jgi:hypothetical protein
MVGDFNKIICIEKVMYEINLISAWKYIFLCAYNSSKYTPRPSIFNDPYCFNNSATESIGKAVASLGPFHKYCLEHALKWDEEESSCLQILLLIRSYSDT